MTWDLDAGQEVMPGVPAFHEIAGSPADATACRPVADLHVRRFQHRSFRTAGKTMNEFGQLQTTSRYKPVFRQMALICYYTIY